MKPVSEEDAKMIVRRGSRAPGNMERELIDFIESEYDMAELDNPHNNVNSARSGYCRIVKKEGYPIRIIARGNRIFAVTIPAYRRLLDLPSIPAAKVVFDPWYICLARDVVGTLDYTPPDDIETAVVQALHSLSDRERSIIEQRYVDRATLEKIGFAFGISKERVRQIIMSAFRKLRRRPLKRLFLGGQGASCLTGDPMLLITNLDLPRRAHNALLRSCPVDTVDDLLKIRSEKGERGFAEWLMSFDQMGKKSAEAIIASLDGLIHEASEEVAL